MILFLMNNGFCIILVTGGLEDADIDAIEAGDIETGSPDIIIAIIDSGIDLYHPDLIDNI
jgi:serine protease